MSVLATYRTLEKEVKTRLQSKLGNETPYKDFGLEVGTVKLVKSGDYTYI
jgi:hypothetical protein